MISNGKEGFVRFIRGTPTAWSKLKNKDKDTLYFISENNSKTGLLYLGSKLILGSEKDIIHDDGDDEEDALPLDIDLNDLNDVSLSVIITDGSVLQYDASKKAWVNKPINTSVPIMTGATENRSGTSGLVPTPRPEHLGLFLCASGTWENPTKDFESALWDLRGTDKGTIREISHDEVSKIFGVNVPENYNTIEKIANWIVNVGDSDVDKTRIDTLEKTTYGDDKSSQTNGLVFNQNRIIDVVFGNEKKEITGLVPTVSNMEYDVLVLKSDVGVLQKDVVTLTTTVNDLDSRLTWKKY